MNFKKILLNSLFATATLALFVNCSESKTVSKTSKIHIAKRRTDTIPKKADTTVATVVPPSGYPPIDHAQYDSLMKKLAHEDNSGKWPVKNAPYPLPGAILPYKRVVAFYGNLYAKKMGILGELPPKEMLAKLKEEVKNWEKVDPSTPVQPALHYIAVVASGDGGRDGKYRNRMPFKQIDSVIRMAHSIHAIVFLDLQVGYSTVEKEVPRLEKYLAMPDVHLGIDPEFSMKEGSIPGKRIGTFDADDINYVSKYLAELVKKYNVPPKIFIVHRFTQKMVTNYQNIKLHPEVQFVMNMDGWGGVQLKSDTYHYIEWHEPVQFTGFKLFYKNDLTKDTHRLLTPKEILELKPVPVYIQYQ